MNYIDERLKHTQNKNLITDSILNTYKTDYIDLLNHKEKYYPLDYITRLIGFACFTDCLKDKYVFPIDKSIGSSISSDDVKKAIKCFDLIVLENEIKRIANTFNSNPYGETKKLFNVFDSLILYGSLLLYAEKNKVYKEKNSLIKKWELLFKCQDIITLKEEKDYTDKLKSVYDSVSVNIQSFAIMIDELKVDDRVFGFYSVLLNILYQLQLKNDTYLLDTVREKILNLYQYHWTGKQYEIKTGKVFPCIEKSYNAIISIEGNAEVFYDWIKQVNLKELFYHYADKIFTDKYNSFIVVLSPSHNTLQFMTEKEFNQYYAVFPKNIYMLCKLKTENPDNININELKAVMLKWINEIIQKVQLVFYELSGYLPDYMKNFKSYSP